MGKQKRVPQGYGEQVFQHLKHMILSRELAPGERIPEGEVAALLHVSRTPVREAVKKLSEYGLVDTVPRSFSVVTQISPHQATTVGELRTALETFALNLVFEKNTINENLLTRLREACDASIIAVRDHKDWQKAFEKDTEFHHRIIRASKNEYLWEAYERLDTRIQLVRLNMDVNEETFIRDIRQHYGVIDMIEAGRKSEAVHLLESHIYNSFTLYQVRRETTEAEKAD